MGSIKFESFTVTRFSELRLPQLLVQIAEMTNRMRQRERVRMRAAESHSFLIVLQRRCFIVQLSFDLCQEAKRLRQLHTRDLLTQKADCLQNLFPGVGEVTLLLRLGCPRYQIVS